MKPPLLNDFALNKVKTGDIFTCAGRGWVSWFIKIWTGSPITHTGIAIWADFGYEGKVLCILEPHMFKGVALNPVKLVLERDYPKGYMYWQANLLDGNVTAKYAMQQWRHDYASPWQFLVLGSRVARWVRSLMGRSYDTDADRFMCSELVARSLIEAGFPWHKEPSVTTPAEVSGFSCLGPPITVVWPSPPPLNPASPPAGGSSTSSTEIPSTSQSPGSSESGS